VRSSLFEELRDNGVVKSLKTLCYHLSLGVLSEFCDIERGLFEVSMEFFPKLINLRENPSHSKSSFPVGNSPIFHGQNE